MKGLQSDSSYNLRLVYCFSSEIHANQETTFRLGGVEYQYEPTRTSYEIRYFQALNLYPELLPNELNVRQR